MALLDDAPAVAGGVAVVPERARGAPARAALVHARGLPRGLAAGAALRRARSDAPARRGRCSASRSRCRSRRRRSTPWSSPRSARSVASRACLPVRRATTRELQWLLRRAACRGVAEPALDDHWEPSALIVETADGQPAYEPLGTDLVRHANAPVLEHDRSLVVDAEEGRSHQAMLGMGALPEESEFPGGAELLFAPLEALAVPGRRGGARALAGQPRGDHARAPADRRRRRRLQRAAELDARAAVVRGRGEPAARARARRLPAIARAAAAAERRDLARRRRPVGDGARARASRRSRIASARSRCIGRSGCSRRCSSITCRAPTAARCATTRTC